MVVVSHAPARPGLARPLFLAVAMCIWAEANDWLAQRYAIGRVPLIALRTLVDCGGVVVLGCIVAGKSSLRDLGWRFADPLRLVAVGVAQTAVMVGVIFGAVTLLGGAGAARELGASLAALTVGQHVYYGLLGIKIAFWEETLFRGDLLRAFTVRFGARAAIVASSVVFAVYHLGLADVSAGWRGVLSLGIALKLVMGLVFALSASRLRSLLPGAIAHASLWAIMGDV